MKIRVVKSKRLKVVPICSRCKQEVAETKNGLAYRHGFKRFKVRTTMIADRRKFSQEDGKPCEGSGKKVLYNRRSI